jgi:CDP-diacylglycerol---serine O-phosphatidyltransferase
VNSPFAARSTASKADRADRAGLRAARVKRGMFLLPSLFTAGGIGLGFYSITQTMDALTAVGNADGAHHLNVAAIAIGFAIPFDALDGRIARMTNTTSDFGKELDSLADAITFGVAPALLAWVWGYHFLPDSMNPQLHKMILQIGSFVCFLYLLCGVSRLARFNISHDPKPRNPGRLDRKYFVGMPIPAAAGMIAATVHFCYGFPIPYRAVAVLWTCLVGLLGFLMVSTWRFWSAKEINFSGRQPFQLIAVVAIVIFVLGYFSNPVLFFVALAYLFSGLWARAAYSWQRRRRQGAGIEADPIPPRSATSFRTQYEQHLPTQMELTPNPIYEAGQNEPAMGQSVPPQVMHPSTLPFETVATEARHFETVPVSVEHQETGPTAAEIEWARLREMELEAERKAARESGSGTGSGMGRENE